MAGGALGGLSRPMRALVPPSPDPVLRRALAGVWRGGARAPVRVQSGLSTCLLSFAAQVPRAFEMLVAVAVVRASTAVVVVVAVGTATSVGRLSGPGAVAAAACRPGLRTWAAVASVGATALAVAVSLRRVVPLAAAAVAALAQSTMLGASGVVAVWVVAVRKAVRVAPRARLAVAHRCRRRQPLRRRSSTPVMGVGHIAHARLRCPSLSRRWSRRRLS